MDKGKKRIITVFIGLAVIGLIAGIIVGQGNKSLANHEDVSTITLKKKNLEEQITVTGKINPIRSRNITTDSMSKIREVNVEEHDKVEEGDILCRTEDTSVAAPISGTVTYSSAKKGEYPKSGENLFVIEDLSKMEIVASITEYDVLDVKKKMKAVITTDAKEGKKWYGKVSDISESATDDKSNFTIKIKINKKSKYLKSGMTAKAKLVLNSRKNTYAVPYDAIEKTSKNKGFVYLDTGVDAEKRFEKIAITTGLESDYYVEIKGKNLKDNMKIISNSNDIKKINTNEDSK